MTDSCFDINIDEGRRRIDPTRAGEILQYSNYARQRRVYAHHVQLLADAMRRDNWMDGSQIAFARCGDRLHLVNGQHRLHAVIESGRPQVFQVLIEACASTDEVDQLYYRFDVTQRQRSTTEILNATTGLSERRMSQAMQRATYEAAGIINNNMRRPHYMTSPVTARSIDDRLDLSERWWSVAERYEHAMRPAPGALRKKLRTSGITAIALATLKHQPDIAWNFWYGLAENDGLRKGDPRAALYQDLLTRNYGRGSQDQPMVSASLAWNAFYAGRNLRMIRVSPNARVRVDGTPYGDRS